MLSCTSQGEQRLDKQLPPSPKRILTPVAKARTAVFTAEDTETSQTNSPDLLPPKMRLFVLISASLG